MERVALWRPGEFARACRRTFLEPADLPLTLRVGWFLQRLPRRMASVSLPAFLSTLGTPGSRDDGLHEAVARVARIRQAWLNRPAFASRDTCYARALTLYHFLPAPRGSLCFRVGVERGARGERLHGHAWVTHHGELLEAPDAVREGRVEPLWAHRS